MLNLCFHTLNYRYFTSLYRPLIIVCGSVTIANHGAVVILKVSFVGQSFQKKEFITQESLCNITMTIFLLVHFIEKVQVNRK